MARKISPHERLLEKCTWRGPDECWTWLGSQNGTGYGYLSLKGRNVYAHRFAWEWVHGPIPEKLEIHHTCENTLCVNPQHLKACTHQENMDARYADKTHCYQGHKYDPIESYPGRRYCRVCRRLRARADRAKGKG